MKKITRLLFLGAVCFLAGCDQDFEEINTNPYAITKVDPGLLFAGAQRTHLGGWESEHTIVQHFVNPFNSGATQGPNFNEDIDTFNNGKWDGTYPTSIKNLTEAIALLGPTTERVNLLSMLRIWKAQVFMGIVDEYGDVPYFETGKAYRENKFFPKYDDDEAIYVDLEKEIRESLAALNPAADFVSQDLFYGTYGHTTTRSSNATDQVAKWKKLGNSLLLRLGMRYSKANPTKAASIASEAFNGGVMTSNADNAFVTYDGTLFTNGSNNGLHNNNPYFYYAAEPFVNQLKSTNDPRSPFIVATFANPGNPMADPNPDTDPANQFGVPIGVLSTSLPRDAKGAGYDYSQMNVRVVASLTAPTYWVTYGQTALLLAEAAHRGWIPGGDAAAQQYYENGIKADIDRYAQYPGASAVSGATKDDFVASAGVAYNPADALNLINTQYWIVNITNGTEAFANFRRSGFPALSPNLSNDKLNGGFFRRFSYPDYEKANNAANYNNAVAAIGGDLVTSRVFWDVP